MRLPISTSGPRPTTSAIARPVIRPAATRRRWSRPCGHGRRHAGQSRYVSPVVAPTGGASGAAPAPSERDHAYLPEPSGMLAARPAEVAHLRPWREQRQGQRQDHPPGEQGAQVLAGFRGASSQLLGHGLAHPHRAVHRGVPVVPPQRDQPAQRPRPHLHVELQGVLVWRAADKVEQVGAQDRTAVQDDARSRLPAIQAQSAPRFLLSTGRSPSGRGDNLRLAPGYRVRQLLRHPVTLPSNGKELSVTQGSSPDDGFRNAGVARADSADRVGRPSVRLLPTVFVVPLLSALALGASPSRPTARTKAPSAIPDGSMSFPHSRSPGSRYGSPELGDELPEPPRITFGTPPSPVSSHWPCSPSPRHHLVRADAYLERVHRGGRQAGR